MEPQERDANTTNARQRVLAKTELKYQFSLGIFT